MAQIIIILFFLQIQLYSVGGSNYSSIGIGDINYNIGAGYNAMAGLSGAMIEEKSVNLRNPALWAYNKKTITQLGYNFNQSFTGYENSLIYQTNGTMDVFSILFNMDTTNGISFGMGLYKNSNVAYKVQSEVSKSIDGLNATGSLVSDGTGGTNTAFLGLSGKIIDGLSLGFMFNYHFGTITNTSFTVYNESYSRPFLTNRENVFTGSNFKLGLNYNYKNFNIAAFMESEAKLKVSSELRQLTVNNYDTTYYDSSAVNFPLLIGLGMSYQTGKFVFGLDFWQRDFSDFGLASNQRAVYNNSYGVIIGGKRIGSRLSGSPTLDKLTYRFGLAYNQLYYSVENQNITEFMLAFGFSANLSNFTNFDMAMSLGSRGKDSGILVQENFIKLNFNISLSEQWFRPFRKSFDDIGD